MAHKHRQKVRSTKSDKYEELMKRRLRRWRKEPAIVRVDNPTKPSRARSLGWKRKKGYIVVRARVRKGGRRKSRPVQGRKTKGLAIGTTPNLPIQEIAEQRVKRKYQNCKVLNSYKVGEGGNFKWFEVLLQCQGS